MDFDRLLTTGFDWTGGDFMVLFTKGFVLLLTVGLGGAGFLFPLE